MNNVRKVFLFGLAALLAVVFITGEAWEAIAKRGFDPARIFAAYFNTLRWNPGRPSRSGTATG